MNVTLKGSEHNKLALIFCTNNLSYQNVRWNRLGYKWEAGDGRTGVISIIGNSGTENAPVPCRKVDRVSREASTHTLFGMSPKG